MFETEQGSIQKAVKHENLEFIVEAGTYTLKAGNIYTMKKTRANVNGDACVYTEGIRFKVDAGGSYHFQ